MTGVPCGGNVTGGALMTAATDLELVIDVLGVPVPQGSMVGVPRGRRIQVLPDNATRLKPWRAAVTTAAEARCRLKQWVTLDGPAKVILDFYLTRPASAARRRWPHVKPDLDKLARACLDALTTAAVYADDSRVVELVARKHYADGQCGVRIRVRAMTEGDVLL